MYTALDLIIQVFIAFRYGKKIFKSTIKNSFLKEDGCSLHRGVEKIKNLKQLYTCEVTVATGMDTPKSDLL